MGHGFQSWNNVGTMEKDQKQEEVIFKFKLLLISRETHWKRILERSFLF